MENKMISKKKAMQFVRETGFAVLDASLYLDTHPCDEKAMDYYNKYKHMYKEAARDYEKNYGPLRLTGVNTCDGWTWTQGPWPWEGGCD